MVTEKEVKEALDVIKNAETKLDGVLEKQNDEIKKTKTTSDATVEAMTAKRTSETARTIRESFSSKVRPAGAPSK
jgi:prefoldin subunit 5